MMIRKMPDIFSKPLPEHIAIILDGNGRWAKKRMMPRTFGHRKGAYNLKDIAILCDEIGIKELTVFAFSTENWNRPDEEVNFLMTEPVKEIRKYLDKIKESNIKISFIGRRTKIPKELLQLVLELEEITSDHKGLHLTICLDYGSRYEICEATKIIAEEVNRGQISVEEITPELIEKNLFTKDLKPLDLLIRTSGELRISNFLLWQLGYAELYFTKTLWPDFNKKELYKAISSFQQRERRHGGLKEEKK